MFFKVLPVALVISLVSALPAPAQTVEKVESRVKKLEGEMRAVQRKVFPGSNKEYFEPEITAPQAPAATPGVAASNPMSDLSARVDSLEQQLVTLTGQLEENSFKLRQIDAAFAKFKTDAEFRMTTLEGGSQPPATVLPPETATLAPPPPPETAGLDPIEGEYRAAYGNVTAKDWAKAESTLAAFVAKHPKHPRASNAQYWLGRTYFAENRPAEAARTLIENYKTRPEGERARESLLWLGKSLMALTPPQQAAACKAYGELEAGHGKTLSESLRTQLGEARTAARCG